MNLTLALSTLALMRIHLVVLCDHYLAYGAISLISHFVRRDIIHCYQDIERASQILLFDKP